jgi:hypothetical protein
LRPSGYCRPEATLALRQRLNAEADSPVSESRLATHDLVQPRPQHELLPMFSEVHRASGLTLFFASVGVLQTGSDTRLATAPERNGQRRSLEEGSEPKQTHPSPRADLPLMISSNRALSTSFSRSTRRPWDRSAAGGRAAELARGCEPAQGPGPGRVTEADSPVSESRLATHDLVQPRPQHELLPMFSEVLVFCVRRGTADRKRHSPCDSA